MNNRKHDWQPVDQGVLGLVADPKRVCSRCGAQQTRQTDYLWMRVTGYKWVPPVGKCKDA
ncbi:MAG: hypothetical protein PVI43_00295 [Candidatus Bathyarchaeota archaeon]